jgi:hypothetical protein
MAEPHLPDGLPLARAAAVAVGTPIDSAAAWAHLADWLPEMLSELLASDVYGISRRPPKGQRGVYLFTESGRHLYVGRTGITARSRAGGGPPITSFRHRFDQHTQPGKPPGAAGFANRLMQMEANRRGIDIPSNWWKNRHAEGAAVYHLFCAAKTRVGEMDCRAVAFEDALRPSAFRARLRLAAQHAGHPPPVLHPYRPP